MENRRVVITGMGAVTPLGLNVESTWKGIKEGKSGVKPLTRVNADEFPMKVAGLESGRRDSVTGSPDAIAASLRPVESFGAK